MNEHEEEFGSNELPEVKEDMEEEQDQNEEFALTISDSLALQRKYVDAIIKAKPGLGEKSYQIAEDLVNTGLTPTEAYALINLVYAPKDLDGRGQGSRLKHFNEAVQERYGDVVLYNAGQNVTSFRRLLSEIGDAVDMRDEVNEQIGPRQTISFRDTLLYQEIGLTADYVLATLDELKSRQGLSDIAAVLRLREVVLKFGDSGVGNLETLLFPREMDGFVGALCGAENKDDIEV